MVAASLPRKHSTVLFAVACAHVGACLVARVLLRQRARKWPSTGLFTITCDSAGARSFAPFSANKLASGLFTGACLNTWLGLGREFFSGNKLFGLVSYVFTITWDHADNDLGRSREILCVDAEMGSFFDRFLEFRPHFRPFSGVLDHILFHFQSPIRRLHWLRCTTFNFRLFWSREKRIPLTANSQLSII
jgi:hypothetical protein